MSPWQSCMRLKNDQIEQTFLHYLSLSWIQEQKSMMLHHCATRRKWTRKWTRKLPLSILYSIHTNTILDGDIFDIRSPFGISANIKSTPPCTKELKGHFVFLHCPPTHINNFNDIKSTSITPRSNASCCFNKVKSFQKSHATMTFFVRFSR